MDFLIFFLGQQARHWVSKHCTVYTGKHWDVRLYSISGSCCKTLRKLQDLKFGFGHDRRLLRVFFLRSKVCKVHACVMKPWLRHTWNETFSLSVNREASHKQRTGMNCFDAWWQNVTGSHCCFLPSQWRPLWPDCWSSCHNVMLFTGSDEVDGSAEMTITDVMTTSCFGLMQGLGNLCLLIKTYCKDNVSNRRMIERLMNSNFSQQLCLKSFIQRQHSNSLREMRVGNNERVISYIELLFLAWGDSRTLSKWKN